MSDSDSHLSCSICYQAFDSNQRRPWDIGCGHSFCEQCLRQHPRSFRYCPECRARASNPHVNISLLRLIDDAGATTPSDRQLGQQLQQQQVTVAARPAAGGRSNGSSPTAMQQQQVGHHLRSSGRAIDGDSGSSGSSSSSSRTVLQAIQDATAAQTRTSSQPLHPRDTISQLLDVRGGSSGSGSGLLQSVRPGDLHGSLDQHRAKIAEWRTSMWLYLTPLMGFLYLLSPLDIIPDIIPLVGFLDDFLVIVYIACSIYSVMQQRMP